MRSTIGSVVFGVAMLGGPAFSQPAADPVGTWLTEDGRAKIRLEKCGDGGDTLCGFVAWMKEPLNDKGQPRTDVKNPDPAKRSRPSLGMEIVTALKPDADALYGGEIYNADDGKMYSVTMNAESATELHVRGCMLRILCGSQTWARVADIPLPAKAAATVVSAKGKTASGPMAKLHDQTTLPAH